MVANPRKADTGFLNPAGTPRRGARDPCAAFPAAAGPHPEEPAARVREQVILFTASLIGEVPGLVFRLQIKIITRLRLREGTLLTRWPADWAKKGVHPHARLSAASFRGRSPTLPHRSFQGSGMTSLPWTLHLATLSVAGRLTAKWVRGTRERRVRPGEIPGQASHSTTQFHAIPSIVQAPTQELRDRFTRAEGLLGSERRGKVCRDFNK
ncbi:uncharacterized protein LOC118988452 [Sturnira hondurensis]|uniref:uncharacterized protein LOC118988452 n=1 Tax=Sturnira hondurensis TaxID=192404 RepID=UPI0018791248|nr:uncharacterized protein LOC118988452 [Sturnira hondurensis]XP_036903960.1 uncharacterized protein LOC118988452 [Sturnira hondurensis]